MSDTRTISPSLVRRLAVTRQRLAAPRPPATKDSLLDVTRDLAYLQLDPIAIVARSHQLVLWSRVGPYDLADLDALLYDDRQLFEYWAHAASIVLTEDYPIHNWRMRNYLNRDLPWVQGVRAWMAENDALHQHILAELRANGPLLLRDFEDRSLVPWASSGWTRDRNVSRMLDFLWSSGEVMVAGRQGIQKLWDISDRCLPDWTPRDELSAHDAAYRAVQKSIRALGIARARDIRIHFTGGRFTDLTAVLGDLERDGLVHQLAVDAEGKAWQEPWYIHRDDLPLLDRLAAGDWSPRTTLLSPFDNLIIDRARTELLWDFHYRMEIYVPKAKRQYGYYVLPILHGDRLIGRVDPSLDRKTARLTLHAIHPEPDAPLTPDTGRAIATAIEDLATFLGATDITYPTDLPPAWRPALQ